MEKKRKLKKFASQADYETQKDSVMGFPHVVLLTDTESLVYQPEIPAIDYSMEYFTIEALEDGLTVSFSNSGLEYSINNGTWNTLDAGVNTTTVNTGDKISFRGNLTPSSSSGIGKFTMSKKCSVQGNVMSLLFSDDFEGKTDLTGYSYAFSSLFRDCTTLSDAINLILPSTTLASYCYCYMFYGCTSLTTAPELPATKLADFCYFSMFYGCSSLITAPALPATTLASYCYGSMFKKCTSLANTPELPATKLKDGCYEAMFENCTSLTVAPELPATTLDRNCYHYMFRGCTSLNHITMLATNNISANNCLAYWVRNVASYGTFVKHPEMTSLPSGDSGIPTGWEINNMSPCIINSTSISVTFNYADGLFTPNKQLIDLSEYLSKEELLSVQPSCDIVISLYDKTDNLLTSDYVWEYSKTLGDVLSELSITTDIYDLSVIITEVYEPEDDGYYYYLMEETEPEEVEPFVEKDYMRIVSLEDDNTITFSQTTQYSINGSEWKKIYGGDVTVNNGDKIYLKNSSKGQRINSTKLISVEGNIMSLLFGVEFEDKTDLTGYDYAFVCLFENCTALTDASNLILPATTLANYCYNAMFNGCTSLINAPALPATTLAERCYGSMFYNCTSLTEAPALPATRLAEGCYGSMFARCTSLINAPELPSTTLANNCYSSMFKGCTSLNHITMLATNINASYCLTNWVSSVSSSGTFIKHPDMTSLPSGSSGIPTGWSVEDDYTSSYFTIIALEDGLTASFNNSGLEYSINNGTWNSLGSGVNTTAVNTGDKISFRGVLTPNDSGIGKFTISKNCSIQGNTMSLLFGDEFKGKKDLTRYDNAFYDLFRDCTTLTDASKLILPATTLASNCYASMFYGCTSLTEAPELPATALVEYCYQSMFANCTSLTTAPELPSTTLADSCYFYMFYNCTSLTTAPVLPASILTVCCYWDMFMRCSKLNHITMLATDISASACLIDWVSGVSSSGTFVKHPDMTSLPNGASGIPTGWAVEDYVN